MYEGALVLVDCLGFKGIWNRIEPTKLINHLQSVEEEAASSVAAKYSSSTLSFGPIRLHLRWLSDTIALSVQYSGDAYKAGAQPDERQKDLLASVACHSAATLCKMFIDSEIPLPLRGCVSFGRHLCEGNFLIGPAVDEAAEYMNEPEGAFIWVLPDAASRHKAFGNRALEIMGAPDGVLIAARYVLAHRRAGGAAEMLEHPDVGSAHFFEALRITYAQVLAAPTVLEQYSMPIKRGKTIDAGIINPFIACQTEEDCKRVIGHYEGFLRGNQIDIWIKRENTLKFLNVAAKAAMEWRSLLGSGEYP